MHFGQHGHGKFLCIFSKNLKLASFYAPNKLADMDAIGIQYAHYVGKEASLWL